MKDKLSLTVRSRQETLYQGEVTSLSSVNDKGTFDVLSKHANYISLIKDFLTIRDPTGKKIEIKIGKGLMRVVSNKVEVFLGIETLKQ